MLASVRVSISYEAERSIFYSLHPFPSTTRRPSVSSSPLPPPFIRALDPERNPSGFVMCSDMQGLVFGISFWDQNQVNSEFSMVRNRAPRGEKPPSITFVSLRDILGRGKGSWNSRSIWRARSSGLLTDDISGGNDDENE